MDSQTEPITKQLSGANYINNIGLYFNVLN